MNWLNTTQRLGALLEAMEATAPEKKRLSADEAMACWRSNAEEIKKEKRTVFLIGNGASASMASHFAADLAKNGGLHTQVFSDLALITALGNDIGYESVFSEPLERWMQPGDMLVAISSSGRSPNILKAATTAREKKGQVVTLSAMDHDNPLRGMGDLNFYIPAQTYGDAETGHAAILHHWMDMVAASHTRQTDD